jgi:Flp pilus assembly protein TadG
MVEFAVVGAVLLILLFGVLEFGRLMYTFAVLGEGTRRAARLAAVCPLGSPNITNTVDFADLPDFTAANVQVQYLDVTGTPTGVYTDINYVQVQIVGYAVPLAIPFINPTVTAPAFTVSLPRESLGVSSTAITACG